MTSYQPITLLSKAGIKRDGTRFDGEYYLDGQWCRFQRGRARKIGGCTAILSNLNERVYGLHSYSQGGLQYQHLGSATELKQVRLTNMGALSGDSDRTPAGLAVSANNVWQFDTLTDVAGAVTWLIAHAAPNLGAIDNDVEAVIWYDDVTATTPLSQQATDPQSGGILVMSPYLITFGNGGRVDMYDTAGGVLNPVSTALSVAGSKLIKGMRLRGGGNGPAGLLWSLDELIRASFTSVAAGYFAFDSLGETSLLSTRAVVEYNGVYFWPGVDGFQQFNGVLRDLPNDLNLDYFYTGTPNDPGLNFAQRQKVFGIKVPRFNEIWWCYPRGSATECTHAIIYNVKLNTWYDTPLVVGGRTDGVYAKVFKQPYMVDSVLTDTGYSLWQHETGTDAVNGAQVEPIPAHFETAELTMFNGDPPVDKSLSVTRLEPDFVQVGSLSVQVNGRANARAPQVEGDVRTFTAPATEADGVTPENQTVGFKDVKRLMSFKFSSNVAGGNFQMGRCIAHIGPADGRVLS